MSGLDTAALLVRIGVLCLRLIRMPQGKKRDQMKPEFLHLARRHPGIGPYSAH